MAREIVEYIDQGRLNVIVKPGASKTEFLSYDEDADAVRISLSAPAIDGKANIALVRFLEKQTSLRVHKIIGKTSRRKTIVFEAIESS